MLAIEECAQQISSLSEHTVRPYALQNKLSHIRTKRGKRGINLGVEVDTIGLFENSSVILNSMGYQLFVEQAKSKSVGGQLHKKFFPLKIALPSTLPLKKIPRKNLCYPQLIGEQLKKKLDGSYHFHVGF